MKNKDINLVQATVRDYIEQANLKNQKIAIACSGGIDSLSLLKALIEVHSNELLLCLHLNHGWLETAKSAQFLVEDFCQKNKTRFISKTYKQGDLNQDENSGRKARYDFFLEACQQENYTHLFLAHNLNDQAETILFRLFRGTNTAGLTGIAFSRLHPHQDSEHQITLHRPLLNINRKDIEAYVKINLETYYQDPSNADDKYHRNLIRNRIISEAKLINPNAEENIARLGALIKEEQEYFKNEVHSYLRGLGNLPWALDNFRLIPRTLQRKILELTFTPNIRFTDEFLNAVELGGFHRINYEKDKYFTIKQKQIWLE